MPSFDWYQASIPRPVDDVLEALAGMADGLSISHAKGMHGYAHTAVLGSEETGPMARVMYGGTHEYPHAIISGDGAGRGAEIIRCSFPAHTVTRLDVKEDFADADAFERMQPELVRVAKLCRLKVGTAGDHLVTMKGRTIMLGAPSSAVRLRLYDKAEEMRSKVSAPLGADVNAMFGIPEHLTRLEAVVRPATREAKVAFATIEPVAALGSAFWMREVWGAVCGLELEPVQVGRGYRQADDERARLFMASQYGAVLMRMYDEADADAVCFTRNLLQLVRDVRKGRA
jgi:hypothetical protein